MTKFHAQIEGKPGVFNVQTFFCYKQIRSQPEVVGEEGCSHCVGN